MTISPDPSWSAATALDDSKTVARLNQRAWQLRGDDVQQALALAAEALALAEQVDDQDGMARSLYILGYCHAQIGNYQRAREQISTALTHFELLGHDEGRADALNSLGNIHSALGDHHSAFLFYLQSLRIRQSIGDHQGEAASWNNIGNVHFHLGDYPGALEAHQRSLTIKQTLGDRAGMAISLNNIGNVYKESRDFPNALSHYERSLALAREIDHKYSQAGALNNIGEIYQALYNPQASYDYYLQSLAIERAIGNRLGEAGSLLQLGQLLLSEPGLAAASGELAKDYLERALALADELSAREVLLRVYLALSLLYERRGDFALALSYYQRFHTLDRVIFDEHLSEQTRKLQIIHEVEASKQEAELRRTETEVVRLKNIELANALTRADRQRQIAEEASGFKTKLLSIAAHDLRNPLHEISGYADLLLLHLPENTPLRPFAERIRHSTQHMTRMLNSLLESSLIDSGLISLEIAPLDLSQLALQVLENNQQRAGRKGQTLELSAEPGCVVAADDLRMWQVLDNLISNAIKFSPRDTHIWVSVVRQGPHIRCSVRDEGPGLTTEDQQRLFGKFERLSARPTDGEDSTGLGLSIVKQLVDLLGGRVWGESHRPLPGSTFVVELPAFEPPASAA